MLRNKTMSIAESLTVLHNDLMLTRRTAMPASVTGVNVIDGKLLSINVQPAIFQVRTAKNGIEVELEELPIIENVPIVMPFSQTTGFSLSVPIAVGDDVLIMCADRSIDNWQDTGKISKPAEPVVSRSHDLTDAIAIIGIFNNMTGIQNYKQDSIEIRNKDGKIYVNVSDNEIKIENNGINFLINSSEAKIANGSSSIKIESNKITIDSELVEITGSSFNLASTTNTTTGGGMTTSAGVQLDNHVHSNPEGGFVGPPVAP